MQHSMLGQRSAMVGRPRTSLKQARADIAARLRGRRTEIEQAAFVRVSALAGSTGDEEPQYLDGLRASVSAAVDYGLVAIELGEERSPPVPAVLHSQARLAARNNVSLDTVLRRYFAGYTLLGDFLIQEAEQSGVQGAVLQSLMRVSRITKIPHLRSRNFPTPCDSLP